MEVWLVSGMGKGPVTEIAALVFHNHGQAKLGDLGMTPPGLEFHLNAAAAAKTIPGECHPWD